MNPYAEMDLATGQVAWNMVVHQNYPLHVVAEKLNRTPEEIHELLLAFLIPGKGKPAN